MLNAYTPTSTTCKALCKTFSASAVAVLASTSNVKLLKYVKHQHNMLMNAKPKYTKQFQNNPKKTNYKLMKMITQHTLTKANGLAKEQICTTVSTSKHDNTILTL